MKSSSRVAMLLAVMAMSMAATPVSARSLTTSQTSRADTLSAAVSSLAVGRDILAGAVLG